jgi:hypothetical protein
MTAAAILPGSKLLDELPLPEIKVGVPDAEVLAAVLEPALAIEVMVVVFVESLITKTDVEVEDVLLGGVVIILEVEDVDEVGGSLDEGSLLVEVVVEVEEVSDVGVGVGVGVGVEEDVDDVSDVGVEVSLVDEGVEDDEDVVVWTEDDVEEVWLALAEVVV